MTPNEVWSLELWEYNCFCDGYKQKQKSEVASCILAGYYTAYYINGGKHTEKPNELINKIYKKRESVDKGISAINRIRELEKNNKEVQ